jgi:hypothetical protein
MSPAKTRTHNEDIDEDVSSAEEEMAMEETDEIMDTEENTNEDADADAEEAIIPADKIEIVSCPWTLAPACTNAS